MVLLIDRHGVKFAFSEAVFVLGYICAGFTECYIRKLLEIRIPLYGLSICYVATSFSFCFKPFIEGFLFLLI